jgi:hypothetical protein
MSVRFGQWVNVVTKLITPQPLGWMSATWSYRNSTVFGNTSGTEQLLFLVKWNILCSYFSITDWQHRSGWWSGAFCTESDDSNSLAPGEKSKVCSNTIPLNLQHHTVFRCSDKTFIGNFHFSELSHIHHKSHSPKAHYNFLHPPVKFSISPPNISLSTTNLIFLTPITILCSLLSISPSHPPISPSAPQISFS